MILEKKTIVVVGCGEIGEPIYRLCCGAFEQVIAIDKKFDDSSDIDPLYPVVAMHIAIPGSINGFSSTVGTYIRKYSPQVVLINSSSVPGATDQLIEDYGEDLIVHTQVHGKHHGGAMRSDMLRHPKFVATKSDIAFNRAQAIFELMGHPPDNIRRLNSAKAGEIVKLLATTFFGYLIAWTHEIERLADVTDVPYQELMSFIALDTPDFSIENKMPGIIGGHCVMPNIEILRESYPSPLWDWLSQSNEMKIIREKGGNQ